MRDPVLTPHTRGSSLPWPPWVVPGGKMLCSEKTFLRFSSCGSIRGLEVVSAPPRALRSADLEVIKVQPNHADVRPALSEWPVTRGLSVEFISVAGVPKCTSHHSQKRICDVSLQIWTVIRQYSSAGAHNQEAARPEVLSTGPWGKIHYINENSRCFYNHSQSEI